MRKIWAAALLQVILILLPASAAADGPALNLTPSPVSLEKTTVGEESSSLSVEVQNVGDSGGSVEGTSLEGVDAVK